MGFMTLFLSCEQASIEAVPNKTAVSIQQEPTTPGVWTRKADYPVKKTEDPIGFTINDKIYIGFATGSADFWQYDPQTNVWKKMADQGLKNNGRIAFSLNGYGYMGGGMSFGFSSPDFYRYDPAANKWENAADFPGETGSDGIGFSIGIKGYVLATNNENGKTPFWAYDPVTDSWQKKAGFPISGIEHAVGFSIGSKGYIGTGFGPTNQGYKVIKSFWEYDSLTDKWTQKADFGGEARWLASGFAIGKKGYIGIGNTNGNGDGHHGGPGCDFWEYNPLTDSWSAKASFKGGIRNLAVGVALGGKGYLGLGTFRTPENQFGTKTDFWEFDPSK